MLADSQHSNKTMNLRYKSRNLESRVSDVKSRAWCDVLPCAQSYKRKGVWEKEENSSNITELQDKLSLVFIVTVKKKIYQIHNILRQWLDQNIQNSLPLYGNSKLVPDSSIVATGVRRNLAGLSTRHMRTACKSAVNNGDQEYWAVIDQISILS